MKKLKSLLILAVALVLVSCSMSAKTEKKDAEPKAQGEVIVLNKADFLSKVFNYEKNKQWAYAGDKPCVIDFYADWCGPCRTMGPVVDQIAKDYEGKVKVGKINVDEEQEIAAQFGIRSIPCFVFMKDGEVADHVVGAVPSDELTYRIDELTKAA